LDTGDDFSNQKRESAVRDEPWGLHPLAEIILSEFSLSPFFEQPYLTARSILGWRNVNLIRYNKVEHGAGWSWVDYLFIERPTRGRAFVNETKTHNAQHCFFQIII